ncbi:MAG: hypothetical protein ACLQPD_31270 [Desulfomonilaceae bacterium]
MKKALERQINGAGTARKRSRVSDPGQYRNATIERVFYILTFSDRVRF